MSYFLGHKYESEIASILKMLCVYCRTLPWGAFHVASSNWHAFLHPACLEPDVTAPSTCWSKQVPRKSLKNPDNSLTLWVIDQGMFDRLWSALFWDLVDITDVKILWLLNRSCDAFLYFSLGLKKILEVAGTVPEVEGGPPLTDNTPMSCSVLLNKLYDDLKSDQERENFNKLCEEYVQ